MLMDNLCSLFFWIITQVSIMISLAATLFPLAGLLDKGPIGEVHRDLVVQELI